MQQLKFWILQFEEIYNGDNWLGDPILAVLTGLPEQIAFPKPQGGRHSIAEIAKHMMIWKYFLVCRLSGDNTYEVDQEASFDLSQYGAEPAKVYTSVLSDLDDCHRRLITLLGNAPDDVLEKPVSGRKYNMGYLINGVLQHDIYHLGQLILLKKQFTGS